MGLSPCTAEAKLSVILSGGVKWPSPTRRPHRRGISACPTLARSAGRPFLPSSPTTAHSGLSLPAPGVNSGPTPRPITTSAEPHQGLWCAGPWRSEAFSFLAQRHTSQDCELSPSPLFLLSVPGNSQTQPLLKDPSQPPLAQYTVQDSCHVS